MRLHVARFGPPVTPADWSSNDRAEVRHPFWRDVRIELQKLDHSESLTGLACRADPD
jgi:hypothetical protein